MIKFADPDFRNQNKIFIGITGFDLTKVQIIEVLKGQLNIVISGEKYHVVYSDIFTLTDAEVIFQKWLQI